MENAGTNATACSSMLASPVIGAGICKIGCPRGGNAVTCAFRRVPSHGANDREVTGSFVARCTYYKGYRVLWEGNQGLAEAELPGRQLTTSGLDSIAAQHID